jgi:hypothetical protein
MKLASRIVLLAGQALKFRIRVHPVHLRCPALAPAGAGRALIWMHSSAKAKWQVPL